MTDEVVACVTSRAAAAIGRSTTLGSLAPGMAGDAAVGRHGIRAGRRLADASSDKL